MSTFSAQRVFLLSTSVIEAVFAFLALFNHDLAFAVGCIISVQSLAAFIFVTSVVLGHLAFDLSNKSLYRCGLWCFIAQIVLMTGLHAARSGAVQTQGLIVASVAAFGLMWLTVSDKKILFFTFFLNLSKQVTYRQNLLSSAVATANVDVVAKSSARGRSRTPKKVK
jgi:hypothetical protein